MKDLLDRLSSYNIFNALFPGIIFVILVDKFLPYSFIQENIVLGIFLYYFIGIVISRLGSLVIEPFLRRTLFLPSWDYNDYIRASDDSSPKPELLLEVCNMYRSLCALFTMLFFMFLYEIVIAGVNPSEAWPVILLFVSLLLIFLFAYRKQTQYLIKRIKYKS